ncbi:MAG TPA: hypothetical protein P5296_16650 [Anaerohalosphaeraceae bacterium]|nr:hypothetical protein [Anaerohalosphaeraceae bacterium]
MKTDLLHSALKWLDHNRWTFFSIVVFAVMLAAFIGIAGCQSTTASLFAPADGSAAAKIDRSEFMRQAGIVQKDLAVKRVAIDAELAAYNEEVKAFNGRVDAGLEDLDRQDEFRAQIVDTVGLIASSAAGGTLNPVSLIPIGVGLLGGALGLGAAADNRRKDKLITDLKQPSSVQVG